MDEIDQANALMDHITELGVRSVLDAMPTGTSEEFCLDCEEEIPLLRREAVKGVTLCIECQTRLERTT